MKTIKRSQTSPMRMGCKTNPKCVIDGGHRFRYVGIGWVDEGPASKEDLKKFPTVKD